MVDKIREIFLIAAKYPRYTGISRFQVLALANLPERRMRNAPCALKLKL